MADIKHYMGETGLLVVLNMNEDVSTANLAEIRVKKPDLTEVTWSAVPYSVAGVPNYILHTTEVSDLDQSGVYELQAYVRMPDWAGIGETAKWVVYHRYE